MYVCSLQIQAKCTNIVYIKLKNLHHIFRDCRLGPTLSEKALFHNQLLFGHNNKTLYPYSPSSATPFQLPPHPLLTPTLLHLPPNLLDLPLLHPDVIKGL